MANTMLPQDYVDLTREFLAFSPRTLFPFTVETVTNYCIKRTPELDPGDDEIIRQIVTETLEMFLAKKCLKKREISCMNKSKKKQFAMLLKWLTNKQLTKLIFLKPQNFV